MIYFFILLYILLALTAVFYIIFFSFIYYWHHKATSFVVVPFIFAFEFFLTGFLIISVLSLILQYLPELVKLIGI